MDLLAGAGASVEDGSLVRVPAELVERSLSTAPRSFTMYDRLGREVMVLEGDRRYYGTGSDCLYVIDHRTGKRRTAVKSRGRGHSAQGHVVVGWARGPR